MEVRGELHVQGPGLRVVVRGDGPSVALEVAGVLRGRLGAFRALVTRLEAAGVRLDVHDPAGRRLASAGAGVISPLGRLLARDARVRPTPRGLLAVVRGHVERRSG